MAKDKATTPPETAGGKTPALAGNVKVRVKEAIVIGGIPLRPKITPIKGRPPKIEPIEAIVPRERAVAYGPDVVEILGDAPEGSKVGPAKKE